MEQKDFFEDGYIKIKAEDYEKMQQQFQKMQQKFQNQAEKIEHLQQQVDILRKLAFGQKSEKTKYTVTNVEQLSFFDEAEQEESRKERKYKFQYKKCHILSNKYAQHLSVFMEDV